MTIELPEEWEKTTVGTTLAKMTGGGTPSRKDPSYWGGDIPWATVKDLKGIILNQTEETITQVGLQSSASNIIPKNTIIIATRMAVGKAVRFTQDVAINQDLRALFPRSDVSVDFLHHWLIANASMFSSMATGTTVKGIRQEVLRALEILLPPLSEQKRIAEVLSSVDDAIRATQAMIEQTRTVKKGLLQMLLTQGLGHTKFKPSPLGPIPETWELAPASELCKTISVGIVIKPAQYYTDTGIRAFRSANVREGFIEDHKWVYLTEEGHARNAKSTLKTGDVLVVRSGYTGTSCVVTEEFDGCNCIDIIFARPKPDLIDSSFLSDFINSPLGRMQVLKAEGGLAQKHFNVTELKKMLVPIPDLNEQKALARHLSDCFETQKKNEQKLTQLHTLKSGLMSDLLTGRVRVKS